MCSNRALARPAWRRRASATMPADTSSPSTDRQRGASASATRPMPQPKSSTSRPGRSRPCAASHSTISAVAAARMAGSPSEYSATLASGECRTAWSKNAAMRASPAAGVSPDASCCADVACTSAARASSAAARPATRAAMADQRGSPDCRAASASVMPLAVAPPSNRRATATSGEITPARHSSMAPVMPRGPAGAANPGIAGARPPRPGSGRQCRCASASWGSPRSAPAPWRRPARRARWRRCP